MLEGKTNNYCHTTYKLNNGEEWKFIDTWRQLDIWNMEALADAIRVAILVQSCEKVSGIGQDV